MSSALSAPHMINEEAAYAYVEARIWPTGPICPHCGNYDRVYAIKANTGKRVRLGLKKCGECRKQFTVKVGTIFESSHVPLNLWLQAMFLMCASKKGISSNQLHRILGVTIKTAWFMSHRLREAMRDGGLSSFGGEGSVVEVDETFIGHDKTIKPVGEKKGRGYAHKHKVLALVDRKSGQARSMVIDSLKARDIVPILQDNIESESHIMTDEAGQYKFLERHFAAHDFTSHGAGEYVRGMIHTNTIEGYFSIFKRGMRGIYQQCAKRHLNRYLAEFDFRYNNRAGLGVDDGQRLDNLLSGITGKRLKYQTTCGAAA